MCRRVTSWITCATMVLITMLVVLVVDQAAFYARRRLK